MSSEIFDKYVDEKLSNPIEVESRIETRKKGVSWVRITILFLFAIFFIYLRRFVNTLQELTFYVGPDGPEIEEQFLEHLKTNLAGNWSRKYTSIPHLAGQGKELLEFTAEKFKEYGLETEVESFDIYLNYPVDNGLKLIKDDSEVVYEASLKEDELEDDPTTIGDDLIPTFHGYSASGNVTAQFVYVNYGTKKDFETLDKLGVELEGKIAIARYGGIFRGLKVKFAQERGCVGVLIYSDPGDDNFNEDQGYKPYPQGPSRNPSSVQRGSVQFLSQMPGDPTTPGVPSQGNVTRVDPYNSIPKIPSLPVSFAEIEPILKKLNGHGINSSEDISSDWVGGLADFKYWTGPNPDYTINLYNEQSYDIRPIYNVYGKLRGRDPSEGYIIIGNHRDAWIKGGASDPNSGSASMLEIIRGFHELSKTGWVPERTIIFASWDGEEYGLLGSTEFGEKYGERLKGHCYAYLNVDVSVGGTGLKLESSPSLNHVLNTALKQVQYPGSETPQSLYEHFYETPDKKIGILGSGSDFTVFLEHLGIPSVDLGFDHGDNDPVYHYHSNYDSYKWMSEMMDPGFKYHQAVAKYLGLVALKLSGQKVVPLKMAEYATELKGYYDELSARIPDDWLSKKITKRRRCHERKHNVNETTIEELVVLTKLSLSDAIGSSIKLDNKTSYLQDLWDNSVDMPFWKRIILAGWIKYTNIRLLLLERTFLVEEGLKGRPWFKHMVYAAGRDTGYEGFALPGMKEALDDSDFWELVKWLKTIYSVTQDLNVRIGYEKESLMESSFFNTK
ncbi:hypothetical protein Kpol_1036p74 [Vanderwaltozyma polyspora DSM 70294]|uniref:FXNA-related family protease 1 n=1 Tax=Vanderwaltozyma polyspora (strain ATCC 22028 / DSM 70294 / BCRC 21397 / CBS 2163 / NBRC 10782 / NRRL Y-8283 / UCD 57-17) TaxID=436907 RepID=A7TEM1_VANPO|nr:uncharacterized protein Kpol_1036p74 [Vanderwaltozyma polyspora DSM 70294]EDO19328.1 hypothetical protein Kpol_1036p74 [Vanderwaltozyma polyspora DSM 70294]